MGTCYITYEQFGSLKRAVVSTSQYDRLKKDSSIHNLTLYPTQSAMERGFSETKGGTGDYRELLLG